MISIGIFAVMWPSGIVHLSELFVSESKSQVYAAVHEFLRNHVNVFEGLSVSFDICVIGSKDHFMLIFCRYFKTVAISRPQKYQISDSVCL